MKRRLSRREDLNGLAERLGGGATIFKSPGESFEPQGIVPTNRQAFRGSLMIQSKPFISPMKTQGLEGADDEPLTDRRRRTIINTKVMSEPWPMWVEVLDALGEEVLTE